LGKVKFTEVLPPAQEDTRDLVPNAGSTGATALSRRGLRQEDILMTSKRIGKLPPRYTLLLNRYTDERLSKCPKCHRLTHPRKFALFIHVETWGPLALGKTCRYCTPCEMVIVHQDELEAELAHSLAEVAPQAVGKEYFVLGTIDKKVWQKGLQGSGGQLGDMLEHTADFKETLHLHVEPGGWRPAGER
jgi:hypothetical protein